MAAKCPKCQADNPETSRFCAVCGTQLIRDEGAQVSRTLTLETPAAGHTRGALFAGRYEILEELGGGGMGTVYRVYDRELEEEIALKLIRPDIASNRETIDRFKNELKLTRKIRHAHVCGMFDLQEEGGALFITMEYVRGEDLSSVMRRMGTLAMGKAISIAHQVAEGLAEAHKLSIIHRDLKPGNIMIDKEGNAKIMDFGVARTLAGVGTTVEGAIIGTPEYMSPEQVEGQPADTRSDLYALGVVLFEMVTGQAPFRGDTPFSVAHKHLYEPPPDPRKLNPHIPIELSRIILRLLEKDRERRYQTAAELSVDLAAAQESLPRHERTTAKRLTSISREISVKFRWKKVLWFGLAVIGLCFAAFIIGKSVLHKPPRILPEQRLSIAVISFENQTGDAGYDYLREAIPNLLITSLEQSQMMRVTSWERLRDLLKKKGKGDQVVIDQDLGFELCRMDGVQAIVLGSYVKAGDTFATDIKVLDVQTKGILKSFSSRGDGVDSILKRQIDDLSREIAKGFVQPEAVTQVAASPIAEATTDSMEAYHHFLRGRDDFEKFYLAESQKSLERAVELDPNFAMAHYYLVRVYDQMGNDEAARQSLAKLQQLGNRVAGKEGLYVQALLAQQVERDGKKAMEMLQKLIADYPNEKRAHLDLGTYYYATGRLEEALTELQQAVKLDPQYGFAMNMLAYTYAQLRNYNQAIEWFEKYALVSPADANPQDSLGDVYYNIGEFDKALEKFEEALRIKPDFGSGYKVSYIYALLGDYERATSWADRHIAAARSNADKAWGSMLKALYFHMQGRLSLSLQTLGEAQKYAEIDSAFGAIDSAFRTRLWIVWEWQDYDLFIKIAKERYDFRAAQKLLGDEQNRFVYEYYQGLFDLKRKGLAPAQERFAAIEKLRPTPVPPAEAEIWTTGIEHLRAEILLAEGRPDEARLAFEKIPRRPVSIVQAMYLVQRNTPYIHDIPGRAYIMMGRKDLAISLYERFVSSDPRERDMEILHPFSRLELAKLYESSGDRGKALAQLEQLAELWKNADPGLPEVEDARKRLAGLKGS